MKHLRKCFFQKFIVMTDSHICRRGNALKQHTMSVLWFQLQELINFHNHSVVTNIIFSTSNKNRLVQSYDTHLAVCWHMWEEALKGLPAKCWPFITGLLVLKPLYKCYLIYATLLKEWTSSVFHSGLSGRHILCSDHPTLKAHFTWGLSTELKMWSWSGKCRCL